MQRREASLIQCQKVRPKNRKWRQSQSTSNISSSAEVLVESHRQEELPNSESKLV